MIGIIDYKTANLGSLVNILKRLGIPSRVAQSPNELEGVERVLLPGIGHFDTCARNLRASGFASALEDMVFKDDGLPLLGICVGAQLLTRSSEEGTEPGLGWINASTHRFPVLDIEGYKVPHMGWNVARPLRPHALFNTEHSSQHKFYFVHSYFIKCDNREDVLSTTEHGIQFDSGVVKGNVVGVQFHPEKSHKYGMSLLAAFANWNPSAKAVSC